MGDFITVSASEARSKFSDLFNQAAFGGKIIIIEKYSQSVCVVPAGLVDRLIELENLLGASNQKPPTERPT